MDEPGNEENNNNEEITIIKKEENIEEKKDEIEGNSDLIMLDNLENIIENDSEEAVEIIVGFNEETKFLLPSSEIRKSIINYEYEGDSEEVLLDEDFNDDNNNNQSEEEEFSKIEL